MRDIGYTKTEAGGELSNSGINLLKNSLECVEKKLEIYRMGTGREKLRQLKEKFVNFSWDVLQNVAVEILSKMF